MQMVTVFGSNTQLGMIQFDKTQFLFRIATILYCLRYRQYKISLTSLIYKISVEFPIICAKNAMMMALSTL